ncbi:putative secreted protein [Wickerhamomyces ciferrii]|uniref:Secreted protein n=1 Tax=Wickerhamomyces ciferrii (strain ATCC 14091 / BCRC 22168 / CBS 111 / JCM 3599 / NBRC 0793 / NRRL Y-1031 F-60-10) TaxID=1206466 RepID=K0KN36_WICCF|nr:uncharacterized protein BN7_3954 [Wickerhamomyces ciferrii]CCH44391.1 putative secreted protein [Wickerhamomyces ciferrii]
MLNTDTLTLVYLLIGTLIAGGNVFKIILGLLVAIVGFAYIGLEFIPSISPPDNFRTEGTFLNDEDEEDVI